MPMTVPPATGPVPVYSMLSPADSMSAVDQLRAKGVRSVALEGLAG